jgi:hypothetical protein
MMQSNFFLWVLPFRDLGGYGEEVEGWPQDARDPSLCLDHLINRANDEADLGSQD